VSTVSTYESPKLLGEYLLLHYGNSSHIRHASLPVDHAVTDVPFPVRCVRALLDEHLLREDATALEIGCSVGASAFELARHCVKVEAGDRSASFITAARRLAMEGAYGTFRTLEGEVTAPFTATVQSGIDRGRVSFSVQDAMSLPEPYGPFDVVLAANLLCRLPDPRALIQRLPDLVKPGGQLMLTTPFTWLEEFTPRGCWIGGRGDAPSGEKELSCLLSGHFRLHRRSDLPFLIREHERKYQLGIALGTSWIRQ